MNQWWTVPLGRRVHAHSVEGQSDRTTYGTNASRLAGNITGKARGQRVSGWVIATSTSSYISAANCTCMPEKVTNHMSYWRWLANMIIQCEPSWWWPPASSRCLQYHDIGFKVSIEQGKSPLAVPVPNIEARGHRLSNVWGGAATSVASEESPQTTDRICKMHWFQITKDVPSHEWWCQCFHHGFLSAAEAERALGHV